ncbi:hypothetical protein M426DRAFT_22268 [Hypoxylon sp. CI-4A]|nr:hypothetical protein M426DRAFT_22268 [Hypoxylon sp. CI-4A]
MARPPWTSFERASQATKTTLLGHHIETITPSPEMIKPRTLEELSGTPSSTSTTTTTTTTVVIATVFSAPTAASISGNPTGTNIGGLSTYCKSNSSTFIDATIPESPPTADCAGIADQLLRGTTNASSWTYDATDVAHRNTTGMKPLLQNGACAFGVVAGDLGADQSVHVGSGDVFAIVKEAVKRFGGAGLGMGGGNATGVAAMKNNTVGKMDVAGVFECGEKGVMVNWALYHA